MICFRASPPASPTGPMASTSVPTPQPPSLASMPSETIAKSQRMDNAADFFKASQAAAGEPMQTSRPATPGFTFHFRPPTQPSTSSLPSEEASTSTLRPTRSRSGTSRGVKRFPSRNRPASSSKPLVEPEREDETSSSLPKFVFHTDDFLATRQTTGSWRGSRNPDEWILSREDLHAEQVDRDRDLPEEMDNPWYPSYVSGFSFLSTTSLNLEQSISSKDLQSLHGYIMSRFDIQDMDEYLQILALFRNTRAIEAHNARRRLMELKEAASSIERLRRSLFDSLQEHFGAESLPDISGRQ